jgi:hypothetical protein
MELWDVEHHSGVTQPLTEMSTRRRKILFLGSRVRPMRRADYLAAICEPTVQTMWDPLRLSLCRPPRHVAGIALRLHSYVSWERDRSSGSVLKCAEGSCSARLGFVTWRDSKHGSTQRPFPLARVPRKAKNLFAVTGNGQLEMQDVWRRWF